MRKKENKYKFKICKVISEYENLFLKQLKFVIWLKIVRGCEHGGHRFQNLALHLKSYFFEGVWA